ncbi:sugar dehydrogenase complex small subunit [Rouxiella sp. Mn2063]|uniref:sugar dehydrogenase complex small subunit n=1 Tax=Rouxiella sp. Mn2063 TaxID=3395262 RepID=UPI003BE8AE83
MKENIIRDDSPPEYRLSRRQVLLGGAILMGSTYLGPSLPAWADAQVNDAYVSQFMQLSNLLVNHKLDQNVGWRLAAAMKTNNDAFAKQVVDLLNIAKTKNAKIVEDFFDDIPAGPLKESAFAIISAWYKGVLVDAPDAEVYAYEKALMYQPTIDVMTIPTYAITGPNGWTSHAPPLADMPDF